MTFLGLVDLDARAATSRAELGNISLTTSAGAGFRNIHPLAIKIAAIDLDKDIDGNIARAARIAFASKAYKSGCDSLGRCGQSSSDGSCVSGDDGLLVSHGLGDRVSYSDGSLGSSVDREKSTVRDVLPSSEPFATSFASTELGIISGTLNIAQVEGDPTGISSIDHITTIASTIQVSKHVPQYECQTYIS
jgi:hypothetical protein